MPTYEYETVPRDGRPPVRFEVRQRMDDPPLELHPETGEPVRMVMSAPFVATRGDAPVPAACGQIGRAHV